MKRSIAFFTIAMAALFTACSNSADKDEIERLRAENEALKASATETVTTTAVSETEATTTEAVTTTETTTTEEKKPPSVWTMTYFVDEWGDPDTTAPYLDTETSNGKFSNSVTVNSELTVEVLVSANYVGFILYKYGYSEEVSYSLDQYKITVIDESNTETTMNGWIAKGSNQVCVFNDEDYGTTEFDTLVELLKNNTTLKFKLEQQSDYSNDEYSFKLDCTGFEDSYTKMLS